MGRIFTEAQRLRKNERQRIRWAALPPEEKRKRCLNDYAKTKNRGKQILTDEQKAKKAIYRKKWAAKKPIEWLVEMRRRARIRQIMKIHPEFTPEQADQYEADKHIRKQQRAEKLSMTEKAIRQRKYYAILSREEKNRRNENRKELRKKAKEQTKIIPFEMTDDKLAKMKKFLKKLNK
jgi:hypothetical protein